MYSYIGGKLNEKIVKYLADGFLRVLESANHTVGTQELAMQWAKKKYRKLSEKEKQEILKKIKS